MQEDWLGTKDEIGSSNVHLDNSNLHLDLVPQELILVTAPKIARGWDWYTDIGYCSLGLLLNSSAWCRREKSWSWHQNCKRIGLVQLLIMILKSIFRYSSTWCRREKSWSRHQNCKRIGWVHSVSA